MTILYPLDLPTVTKLVSFNLRERNVAGVSVAPFSGAQQVQDHQGSWWEADFGIRPLPKELYDPWASFFTKLNGRVGTFIMGHPLITTTVGSAAIVGGTPQVDGNNQKGKTLAIKTQLGNLPGYLKAGDFFSIGLGANRRMHKVLNDVTLVGGKAILDIWPKLRYSPPDNDLLYFTNQSTLWRMTVNVIEAGLSGSDAGLYRFPTITAVEAF